MKRLSVLLFALALAACGQNKETSAASQQPAAAPAKPNHNYVLREKGKFGYEYGYESAVSENAKKAGRVTGEVIMMRYHGYKDGVYQLSSAEKGARLVIQCEMPCEFFKQTIWSGATVLKTERVRLAEGSVAWAMIQDAQNGFLEQLSKVENGKEMRAWVTDEGPRWEAVKFSH